MADIRDPRAEAAFLASWDASSPGDTWRISLLLALVNKIEFFGPEGIQRLRMMLASPHSSERYSAVEAMGRAGKPILNNLLVERAGIETDPVVQAAIARAIEPTEP